MKRIKKKMKRIVANLVVAMLILIAGFSFILWGSEPFFDIYASLEEVWVTAWESGYEWSTEWSTTQIDIQIAQKEIELTKFSTQLAQAEAKANGQVRNEVVWQTVITTFYAALMAILVALTGSLFKITLGQSSTTRMVAYGGISALRERAGRSLVTSYKYQNRTGDQHLAHPLTHSLGQAKGIEAALVQSLESYGIPVKVNKVLTGPTVVSLLVERGTQNGKRVLVADIKKKLDDVALDLGVASLRVAIESGTLTVQIPKAERSTIMLKEMFQSTAWRNSEALLPLAIGQDVVGDWCVPDLAKMPHLLVAGATGSGKSVALNAILVGLLEHNTPHQLQLILVDPKMVELGPYKNVPHTRKIVKDMDEVPDVLTKLVTDMKKRYELMEEVGVRDIEQYNSKNEQLPRIVIVFEELASLMETHGKKVTSSIKRLGAEARAAGIHIIALTQRPSIKVIPGDLKSNFGGRLAFSMVSQIDSRVILDEMGAERLLGRGDGLIKSDDIPLQRIQSPFIDNDELHEVLARMTHTPSLVNLPLIELKASTKQNDGQNDGHDGQNDGHDNQNDGQNDEMTVENVIAHENDALMMPAKSKKEVVFQILRMNPKTSSASICEISGATKATVRKYRHEFKKEKR